MDAHLQPAGREPKAKIAAILISADDSIWPQIGKFVPSRFTLKQVDSIEQLLEQTDMGAAAVLLWDVRQESDIIARLSCLQQHSPRFSLLVFDLHEQAATWEPLIRQNQVIARIDLPIAEGEFVKSLNHAGEEVQARAALLGEPKRNGELSPAVLPARSRAPWFIGAAIALCAVLGVGIFQLRSRSAPPATIAVQDTALPAVEQSATAAVDSSASAQVETLLENAGQSMLERRYVAPVDNNALYFYRRVLTFDAANGEAKQGLERLAELLLSRAQSAVDQRQFEQALQSLEIARSLKPNDPRTDRLDQRLSSMRSELGATQIQAAMNAQNFERAATLIDEAFRAKTVSPAQAAQLREALKSQRSDFESARLVKLAQARLQQDRLIDPPGDSAAFYLDRARRAGISATAIAVEARTLQQKVLDAARGAIEQRRFTEADRWLAEARNESVSPVTLTALQNDLATARGKEARAKSDALAAATQVSQANADLSADRAGSPAAAAAPLPALVLLQPLRPDYPRDAVQKGVEGWVELSFVVTASGKPVDVRATGASPAGVFDKAAIAALQRARYRPLSTTDESVTRQASLRVSFRLSR
jgi:TonB family protein